jgi:hypothetical protein
VLLTPLEDREDAKRKKAEMNALTFDTLKLARKLEAAGFYPEQAAGASAALA